RETRSARPGAASPPTEPPAQWRHAASARLSPRAEAGPDPQAGHHQAPRQRPADRLAPGPGRRARVPRPHRPLEGRHPRVQRLVLLLERRELSLLAVLLIA